MVKARVSGLIRPRSRSDADSPGESFLRAKKSKVLSSPRSPSKSLSRCTTPAAVATKSGGVSGTISQAGAVAASVLCASQKACERRVETVQTTLRCPESSSSCGESSMLESSMTDELLISAASDIEIPESFFEKSFDLSRTDGACSGVHEETEAVINEIMAIRGLPSLYDWQRRFLQIWDKPCRAASRNILLSMPTSGGKSLVAEIHLILETRRGKDAIFVLPFVALVQEKVQALALLSSPFGFFVEEYAHTKGRFPPQRRKKPTIYVATIEKAHTLFNVLVAEGRGAEVGLVVVDEIHMLGTDRRGTEIESFLCKLMSFDSRIKIMGMSATVGNLQEIAEFLDDAILFQESFRPVSLEEHLVIARHVFQVNPNQHTEDLISPIRELDEAELMTISPHYAVGSDVDLISLLANGAQTLVFCATKRHCQTMAVLLAKSLPRIKEKDHKLLKALESEIRDANDGVVFQPLSNCIRSGAVAYHHSGLNAGTRQSIEDGFRRGILRVICCTSTLAAGVNLPAQRVVIRSPFVGRSELSRSQYLQMIGRAGRAGFDVQGESYLVCKQEDMKIARSLLESGPDLSISQLMTGGENSGFRSLIVSLIGLKIATRRKMLLAAVTKTLAYLQSKKDESVKMETELDVTLEDLETAGLIRKGSSNDSSPDVVQSDVPDDSEELFPSDDSVGDGADFEYEVTQLGQASLKTGISLGQVKATKESLMRFSAKLDLSSPLQLLCLCYPGDKEILIDRVGCNSVISRITQEQIQIANSIGVTQTHICGLYSGSLPSNVPAFRAFFAAIVVLDIWNGSSIRETAKIFYSDETVGITEINTILQNLEFRISSLCRFSELFEELWPLAAVLPAFQTRLNQRCTNRHLQDLMELPSVKKGRAHLLYSAGLRTVEDVAVETVEGLRQRVPLIPKKQARAIISSARMMLEDKRLQMEEETLRLALLLSDKEAANAKFA